MKKLFSNNKGLSIIEILVAVTVITMTLLSVALLSTKSVKFSRIAQDRQEAISIARETIEQVRYNRDTMSWIDFVTGYSTGLRNFDDSKFSRQLVVVDEDGNSFEYADDMIWLQVTVFWYDGDSNNENNRHEVYQETYLRNI